MSNKKGHVIVYGGNGVIGKACIDYFKVNGWWVGCIELSRVTDEKSFWCNSLIESSDVKYQHDNVNKNADTNILINSNSNLQEQEEQVIEALSTVLDGIKLDAVICVAGGFIKGNTTEDLSTRVDLMWKQNVCPSIVSATIATKFLKPRGFLCLSGAKIALSETPNMIAYGLAKAAVNQLAKSLASEGSGLPPKCLCIGLLPINLDEIIRDGKQHEMVGWTPTKYIVQLLYKWTTGSERPTSGSLVNFVTKDYTTEITFV